MTLLTNGGLVHEDSGLTAPGGASGALRARTGPESAYGRRFKRLLDLALVGITAPITVPLIALLALLVWIDGGQPFFRQERVGRGGRVFRILKLRSMVRDAETCLQSYLDQNPDAALEWSVNQKLVKDPRITALGRLLRSSSLDELPQLWNVVTGDMSLVGPRPMMPSQVDLYPGRSYYLLRPGITGPWQVSERHQSGFAKRAAYDDSYARTLCMRGDVALLRRTVSVVLGGRGC